MLQRVYYPILIAILIFSSTLSAQDLVNGPDCATYDVANDRYFISNYYEGRVIVIENDGTQSVFAQGLGITNASHIVGDTLYTTGGFNYLDAWDLTTGERLYRKFIASSNQVDGIMSDSSGYLYITSYSGGPSAGFENNQIMRFNIATQTSEIYISSGLDEGPQDFAFDEVNNRLLLTSFDAPGKIMAIDLADASLSTIVTIPYPLNNGIEKDNDGNWYVTCYNEGQIFKYDNDFANPPIVVSTGHFGPTALGYNPIDNVLAVPNFISNTVDFIPLDDRDGDNVLDFRDNCVELANTDQLDADGDGDGDVCDGCPYDYNPFHEDADEDGVEDACDNCPEHYNPEQEDSNGNDVGDLCDYVCGDIDGNAGVNILDVVYIINYKYKSGPAPDPMEAADVNKDLSVNILDVVYLINYKYKTGPEPECVLW